MSGATLRGLSFLYMLMSKETSSSPTDSTDVLAVFLKSPNGSSEICLGTNTGPLSSLIPKIKSLPLNSAIMEFTPTPQSKILIPAYSEQKVTSMSNVIESSPTGTKKRNLRTSLKNFAVKALLNCLFLNPQTWFAKN